MTESKASIPRIAIPIPHSGNATYAERSLPQYEDAVRLAGGEPVRISLDQTPTEILRQAESCDGVLLPGSPADVDPQKYKTNRHPKTAAADAERERADELLLQDAYSARKPVLGICYGLQSLNVFRAGSLLQHIESPINHSPGKGVANAHALVVAPQSRLAAIVGPDRDGREIAVNSSHHQSAERPGEGLRVSAQSAQDGIIEALEGTAPEHFVLAVQWHPERSVNDAPELSQSAKAIFRAFVDAARARPDR